MLESKYYIEGESKHIEGFTTVPYQEGNFLIRTPLRGSGLRVLGDATILKRKNGTFIGHKPELYANSLPPDITFDLVAVNETNANDPEFIARAISEYDLIYGLGGEDLTTLFHGDELMERRSEKAGYGLNRLRCMVNKEMIEQAVVQNKLEYDICRLAQAKMVLEGGKLTEVPDFHRPPEVTDEPVEHEVVSILPAEVLHPDFRLKFRQIMNSHHHHGVRLGDIDRVELSKNGWYVQYVSLDDGFVTENSIIESAIHLHPSGVPDKILIQAHPERGIHTWFRDFARQSFEYHAQLLRQPASSWI